MNVAVLNLSAMSSFLLAACASLLVLITDAAAVYIELQFIALLI